MAIKQPKSVKLEKNVEEKQYSWLKVLKESVNYNCSAKAAKHLQNRKSRSYCSFRGIIAGSITGSAAKGALTWSHYKRGGLGPNLGLVFKQANQRTISEKKKFIGRAEQEHSFNQCSLPRLGTGHSTLKQWPWREALPNSSDCVWFHIQVIQSCFVLSSL